MLKSKNLIKSPLRYPGGKSKAVLTIEKYLPADFSTFSEYREPFIGGGSVFIYLKQKYPDLKFWINDLNSELYCFWFEAKENLEKLIEEIYYLKRSYQDGKKLFDELVEADINNLSKLERATRFFILNRITFSGTVEAGGFSSQAFQTRFTDSSIERLALLKPILKDTKITNLDYTELLKTEDDNIFLFLDPPYYKATKSKLYGKRGALHTCFDHKKFLETIENCANKWLITYDNSPIIENNFNKFYLYEWELQYGMNNYKRGKAEKGKELIIINYPIVINRQYNLFEL